MHRRNKLLLAFFSGTAFFFAGSCIKNHDVPACNVQQTGPLYFQVKTIITNRCTGCHNNSLTSGGEDFTNDCNIRSSRNSIKEQAVDQENMPQGGPPLSATEKSIITRWINEGGTFDK